MMTTSQHAALEHDALQLNAMTAPRPRVSARDERGVRDERGGGSTVVLVLCTLMAVLLVAGLVVDGGRKVSAAGDATAIAGQAARTAANAAATNELAGGGPNLTAATTAAGSYFAKAGVNGSITFTNGQVYATVSETRPTVFLSMIGIGSVEGHGSAHVQLYATGQRP